MTTSVIYRAIGRPITFKGFKAQYIILAAAALIADFLFFILMYFSGVPWVVNIILTIGLGSSALLIISKLSHKLGQYGLLKYMAFKRLPHFLRDSSLQALSALKSGEPAHQPVKLHPYLEINQSCIVSKDGDITMGFQLFLPEQGTLSATESETSQQSKAKAVSLLPSGTIVVQQDWYTSSSWQVDPADNMEGSYLSDSCDRHFHGQVYPGHRSFLFITLKAGERDALRSLIAALVSPRLMSEYVLDPARIKQSVELSQQFIEVFCAGGVVQYRKLEDKELDKVIQHYRRLMAPELCDIRIKDRGIQIGDKEVVICSIADAEQLPVHCSSHTRHDRYSTDKTSFYTCSAAPLGSLLHTDHVYSQFISIEDSQSTRRKLETRGRRLKSLSTQDRENAVAYEDTQHYLNEAAAGNKPIVKAHYNVIAWTDRPEKEPDLKNKVLTAMSAMGVRPRLETVWAAIIWLASQPGNAGYLPFNDSYYTFVEQALCFFISESNSQSAISPLGIRFGDRQTGVPLQVDISDEPLRQKWIDALCKFIVGPTGTGKSFLCNHLIRHYYQWLAHIVIVDIGNSYKALCELLGGCYISYSLEDPIRFNPFLLADDEIMDVEKRESLKGLLQVLWKQRNERFSRAEYVVLSNMLEGYYAYLAKHRDVFPCFDSFYEWLQEDFTRHIANEGITERNFDFDNFLYVLRPYFRGGEYDYLLNSRDRADLLHERLIVFELDQIKDHPILFPVVTIVIMDAFLSKIRSLKGIKKVLLLDEAWKAIAKEGMDEYIRCTYKTVRKFSGEPILVTQEIEDIISSPVVKNTIINMSDCKILLDVSKFTNRFDEIQSLLGLSEKDKALVLSLNKANEPRKNYKEVFISLGMSHSRVYRLEVSLEEYLVYTTKESEKVKVQEYLKRFGNLQKGVAVLAADIRSGAIKWLLAFVLSAAFLLLPNGRASAQIIDLIDAAVKKVLISADLAVQRLQTQTLVLQTVQKDLENSMQDGLLGDITGWVQQQEDLYQDYYQGLWQVKSALTSYSKVKGLIQRQAQLLKEYNQAQAAICQDSHFNPGELAYISSVYDGLLNESIRNTGQLVLVMGNFLTQMDDAARLRTIDETAGRIDHNYSALRSFSQQTTLLSLQRSKDMAEIQAIQNLYGIQ
jgi:conjugation system TraG family ATPase